MNIENGKTYIGSSVNLSKRLSYYYSKKHMETQLKKGKSAIYSSILKNGLSNFQLGILEYCEPDNAVSREQYYIDLLKPEYNILPTAGSLLGFKHSEETLEKISASKMGNSNWLGKTHSEQTKAKISVTMMGNSNAKNKSQANKIEVLDLETNNTTIYDSIRAAARALNCVNSAILKNLKSKSKKPYKGRYVFRLL